MIDIEVGNEIGEEWRINTPKSIEEERNERSKIYKREIKVSICVKGEKNDVVKDEFEEGIKDPDVDSIVCK